MATAGRGCGTGGFGCAVRKVNYGWFGSPCGRHHLWVRVNERNGWLTCVCQREGCGAIYAVEEGVMPMSGKIIEPYEVIKSRGPQRESAEGRKKEEVPNVRY